MFSKITAEFDAIEYAESAARRIKETIYGTKKMKIFYNINKYKNRMENKEEKNATHGEVFYLLPTAINSYNYITGQITRPVNSSLFPELLLTSSVKLEVMHELSDTHEISQIILSSGGYEIKRTKNLSKFSM